MASFFQNKLTFFVLSLILALFLNTPISFAKDIRNTVEYSVMMGQAKDGNIVAQLNLGRLYFIGEEVPQSYAKSIKWYELAAKQHSALAQNNLGAFHANGWAVPQDYAKAALFYRLSAEQGLDTAQNNLGKIYEVAQGVPQNYAEAIKWYKLAVKQKNIYSQYSLGSLYAHGKGIPQNYTMAAKLYKLAAEQGFALAQYSLGFLYDKGQGVPQNYVIAAKWYRLAAEQGQALAQNNLGNMYEKGQGVPKNDTIAEKWYRSAIKQGDKVAQANLDSLLKRKRSSVKPYTQTGNAYPMPSDENTLQTAPSFATSSKPDTTVANILMIAGAVIIGNELLKDNTPSTNDVPTDKKQNTEYIRCAEKINSRITSCRVSLEFGACDTIGCNNKVDCDKGYSAHRCNSKLSHSSISWGNYYCDTKTSFYDESKQAVINETCQ